MRALRQSKPLGVVCFVFLVVLLAVLVQHRSSSNGTSGSGSNKHSTAGKGNGRAIRQGLVHPYHSSVFSSSPKSTSRSSGSKRKSSSNEHAKAVKPDTYGMMVVPPTHTSEHPITTLIRRGKDEAEAMEKKIQGMRFLRDAVKDYEDTFGMKPPRGFEKWYQFARDHQSLTAPSLIPQAHLSILPFLSYPASLLRERLSGIEDKDATFTFEFFLRPGEEGLNTGSLKRGGYLEQFYRTDDTELLLTPIIPYLPLPLSPNEPNLKLFFSGHDGPSRTAHREVLEKSLKLAQAGRIWDEEELKRRESGMRHTHGWSLTCPKESPLRKQSSDLLLNDLTDDETHGSKSFIEDVMKSYDYCYNPKEWQTHGTLINDKSRAAGEMIPHISTCKLLWNTDVLGVPLDAVNQTIDFTSWSSKTIPKAFWRGTLTGAFHNKDTDWRNSQRERMAFLVKETQGTRDVLIDLGNGKSERKEFEREVLNERYMDVAPVGGAVQCDPGECEIVEAAFDFGGRVSPKDTVKYKFNIDMDGNGWSSRFTRLLKGNSVILKSTLFPEWFTEALIPWYHYVPTKLDYSDVYDIMAYFTGAPDGSGVAHDDEAKTIARNAWDFTEKRMRWEDMQSYTLLLALEWNRMVSDDREAASYHKVLP